MTNLSDSLSKRYGEVTLLRQELTSLETTISGAKARVQDLQADKDTTVEAWETLRLLLEEFSKESLDLLAEMVNRGIGAIFDDRSYTVKFEVTDHKNKSLRIYLEEKKGDTVVRSRIPDAIGGGVQVVLSFIINVFLIRIYSNRPFMVMDEAFTQISSQYLDNFLNFLRYLIDDMGFTFLWVSHDTRVFPHFDTCYEVTNGKIKKLPPNSLNA